MYTSIALISSVVALTLSNPLHGVPHRHPVQQPQNNLNPNLFAPIEDKIYAASKGSRYRPDLSDSEYVDFNVPRDVKKGAIRVALPDADPIRAALPDADPNRSSLDSTDPVISGVPNKSKLVNELDHIIRENNAKIRGLKTPVLSEAEPIANVQDPNNVELFEKIPHMDERIPVVNREIFKVPNRKQTIPDANEGIVYNAPKVYERVPIQDNHQIDLEDPKIVEAVINKLDEPMENKAQFQSKLSQDKEAAENKMAVNEGKPIHHGHHHHLHRGADMVDKAERTA